MKISPIIIMFFCIFLSGFKGSGGGKHTSSNTGSHYGTESFDIQGDWKRDPASVIYRFSGFYLVTRDTILNPQECFYRFIDGNAFEIVNDNNVVCRGTYEY